MSLGSERIMKRERWFWGWYAMACWCIVCYVAVLLGLCSDTVQMDEGTDVHAAHIIHASSHTAVVHAAVIHVAVIVVHRYRG